MILLAADPGLDGAMAYMDGNSGELIDVVDLPTIEEAHGKGTRRCLSPTLLHDELLARGKVDLAVVEHVTASPQMGTVSAYRMGQAFGALEAVLQCRGIRLVRVRPQTWKKALGLSPDKEVSRARAIETWPDRSDLFRRKLDHNRAEAALLVEYARKHLS